LRSAASLPATLVEEFDALGQTAVLSGRLAGAASIANTALNASQKRIGEYDPDRNRGNDQASCIGPWSSQ
jgi:hypothetical protein